jgi:hypothetical protein
VALSVLLRWRGEANDTSTGVLTLPCLRLLQVESRGNSWRDLQQACLARQGQQQQQCQDLQDQRQQQPPAVLLGASVAATYAASSGGGGWQQQVQQVQQVQVQQRVVQLSPPYAPPPRHPAERSGSGSFPGGSGLKALRPWGAQDVLMAAGSRSGGGEAPFARHPLQLESSYRAVTGSECPYSTCHDKFIGAVDYIWSSRAEAGSGWQLLPLGVLLPPPLQTLSCALPSPAWPSDHVSLVTDFAYLPPLS